MNIKSKKPRMKFELFVSQAENRFPGKFSYFEEHWQGKAKSTYIECHEHGMIKIIPKDFLKSVNGCKHCSYTILGVSRRRILEDVIEQFKNIHGNRYDYSHTIRLPNGKFSIICSIHGEFTQSYYEHISGSGCQKCAGRHQNFRYSELVKLAKEKHNGKYEYPEENDSILLKSTKIPIICKIHGLFNLPMNRHIDRKHGCPSCGGTKRKTTNQFICESIDKYGDKFIYDKVDYVNAHTEVLLICRTHGEFYQKPMNHFGGMSCPRCTHSVSSIETEWLDFLKIPDTYRQPRIKLSSNSKIIKPDAYDPITNTVYEFWGDWWHGNPIFFKGDDFHPISRRTYGELYSKTLEKRENIINSGYNLIEIWEHEWKSNRSIC